METKTSLRKYKKNVLLDKLREAYPWKPNYWYDRTKEEIIDLLIKERETS